MRLRTFIVGALMVSAPALIVWALAMPSAVAQVAVSPASVEISLAEGEQSEVKVRVTNEGTAPISLFAVPLPESGMLDGVGEMLFFTDVAHYPYGMTMTPEGRLFVADDTGANRTRDDLLRVSRTPS